MGPETGPIQEGVPGVARTWREHLYVAQGPRGVTSCARKPPSMVVCDAS